MTRRLLLGVVGLACIYLPSLASARVLLVGTYHGIKGQYTSIAAAVKAAHANDWILVGPGDYKTQSGVFPSNSHGEFPAGILITKPGIYLRGMNRNTVIVDGTESGPPCNHIKADQNFGPKTKSGPAGLNGIEVWKANNVWVQNLSACNFLGGSGGDGGTGNEIWWNGGAGSGTYTKVSIGGHGYVGSYLTATSTWYPAGNGTKAAAQKAEISAAEYGIFSSNWSGGNWNHDYASNFNDSGFYIGACGPRCDQTVNHVWAEWNALGYSGSNSGGRLLVENSQWDHNETGFSTNSQEGDNPPPQNGACPKGVKPPIKGAQTCWVFFHNYVHDNNTPDVPTAGLAGGGPVGDGVSMAGGRNDTLLNNLISHNGSWGITLTPFPGSGPPCTGGVEAGPSYAACVWDSYGDAVFDNTFTNHNGFYGNPTNGDFAVTSFFSDPTDCFGGNKDKTGLTATPSNAETMYPKCNGKTVPPMDSSPQGAMFTEEVACDSTLALPGAGKSPCLPTDHYPRVNYKKIHNGLHPLPAAKALPTMPNPCQGVPHNPWCPAGHSKSHGFRRHATAVLGFTG